MRRAMHMLWAAAVVSLWHCAHADVVQRWPNVPITDTVTVLDQIQVTAGPALIHDVNVIIRIDHPDPSQLDIALIPPGGNEYLVLSTDNGFASPNFARTRFDDDACRYIYSGQPPFFGTFKPEGGFFIPYLGTVPLPAAQIDTLSQLNGRSANGTWTLLVDDDTNGLTGVLRYWALEFNGSVDTQGPPGLNELCTTAQITPPVVREGVTITLRVNVTPRTNPPSTGLDVWAFLDQLDGPLLVQLFDDGMSGDGAANDNVFGLQFTVPSSTFLGVLEVPYYATDIQGRTGEGVARVEVGPRDAWYELFDGGGDAGSLPAVAQPITAERTITQIRGSLDDRDTPDVYALSVCQPSLFSASTVGGASYDTQLFLFDSAGRGVTMNDDAFTSYQSTITSQFLVEPGEYYLAISRFDLDPVDFQYSEIWDDAFYFLERQPDGPGAGNPVTAWSGLTFNPVGAYTIFVQGVGRSGLCPQSSCDTIDFNNDGLYPDTADIDSFVNVFAGGGCVPPYPPNCNSDIDFNNDGLYPDVLDMDAFLRVFSGGLCEP